MAAVTHSHTLRSKSDVAACFYFGRYHSLDKTGYLNLDAIKHAPHPAKTGSHAFDYFAALIAATTDDFGRNMAHSLVSMFCPAGRARVPRSGPCRVAAPI